MSSASLGRLALNPRRRSVPLDRLQYVRDRFLLRDFEFHELFK